MLFRRKQPPRSEGRWRSAQPAGSHSRHEARRTPAFSYYASRAPRTAVPAEPLRRSSSAASSAPTPPRRHLLKRWPQLLVLVVVLVCVGKILYVSGSPKIVVKQTDSGQSETFLQPESVYAAAAAKDLRSGLANRLKLTADVTDISQSLMRQFPELESASVVLPLIGNRPIVYLTPAQPSLIMQASDGGNFALNDSGTALAKVTEVPAGSLLVQDQTGSQPRPGEQVLPGATVGFIQTVAYQLKAAKLQPQSFTLPATSAYELDVRLAGKPYLVRFNLQASALEQSGAVVATIAHLGSTVPNQYIDARVPERIYYK